MAFLSLVLNYLKYRKCDVSRLCMVPNVELSKGPIKNKELQNMNVF